MNWDAIKLNWKRLIPEAKTKWPELADRDIESAAGDQQALNRAIAKASGITEQEARHQTQEWGLALTSQPGDINAPEARRGAAPEMTSGDTTVKPTPKT